MANEEKSKKFGFNKGIWAVIVIALFAIIFMTLYENNLKHETMLDDWGKDLREERTATDVKPEKPKDIPEDVEGKKPEEDNKALDTKKQETSSSLTTSMSTSDDDFEESGLDDDFQVITESSLEGTTTQEPSIESEVHSNETKTSSSSSEIAQ